MVAIEKLAKIKTCVLKAAIGLAVFTPLFFIIAALETKIGGITYKSDAKQLAAG